MKSKDIFGGPDADFYYTKHVVYYMKKLVDRIYGAKIHLICWAIWIAYEVGTTAYIRGQFSPVLFYVLFYGLNIGVFYLHGKVLLPWALDSGISWLWKLPLALALEIIGYAVVSVMLNLILSELQGSAIPVLVDLKFFVSMLWRAVLFMLFSTGYYFLSSSLRRRKLAMERVVEIERLNSQLLRAERDYLRSQINPHLLFNTLSFVKFAARTDRSQAEEAIQRLAALMRFALEKSENGLVELSDEILHARHLIRLNQLRFGEELFIELIDELNGKNVQIVPVMLLTLVENIFKHGNLKDPACPAKIMVSLSDKILYIRTNNLVDDTQIQQGTESFGTGLVNLKDRLAAGYPDGHQLYYSLTGQNFEVSLQIDLDIQCKKSPAIDSSF